MSEGQADGDDGGELDPQLASWVRALAIAQYEFTSKAELRKLAIVAVKTVIVMANEMIALEQFAASHAAAATAGAEHPAELENTERTT